jgi:ABC-type transport system substrate-binding protein
VTNKDNPSGANNYHICDPKLDEMWDAGLATADPAARKKVYDEIQQYMYDNVLMIPLYARANVYAFRDNFVFPPSSGYANAFWDAEEFDTK